MKAILGCWLLVRVVVLVLSSANADEPPPPAHNSTDDGWTELFDGKTLDGWQRTGAAEWRVAAGRIVTMGGKAGWLMTSSQWSDFELHVEFMAPATTNSGVFLRTVLEPTDPTRDCVELNIAPRDNPFPTCSLVGRRRLSTQPQRVHVGDTSGGGLRPVGEPKKEIDAWDGKWHAFDVVIRDDSADVSLDGQRLDNMLLSGAADGTAAETPRRGHVGLQSKEGEVAYRNIRIRDIRDK